MTLEVGTLIYVVEEPDKPNNKQAHPVMLGDEQVRDFNVFHRLPLEFLGLLELKTNQEQRDGRDDT